MAVGLVLLGCRLEVRSECYLRVVSCRRLGLVVDYLSKRDDVKNNQVDKLKAVDQALMLGGLVGYDLQLNRGTLGFEVEGTHDVIDGNDGWLLQPEVRYQRELNKYWGLHLGSTLTCASDNYMDSYFSISPADSARSGLATYHASNKHRLMLLKKPIGKSTRLLKIP